MLPDLGSRGLFNCISFMLWQAGMLQHPHLSHSACSTGVTGTPCPVQPKTAACRSESPRSSFYIAAAPDLMGMGGSQTLLAVSWQAPPKPLLSSSRQFPLQTGLFCCTKPHCGMETGSCFVSCPKNSSPPLLHATKQLPSLGGKQSSSPFHPSHTGTRQKGKRQRTLLNHTQE